MKRGIRLLFLFCLTGSLLVAENNGRYENLGGKIMCSCGCTEMLLKCNHVGCPNSAKMIRQLREQVASTNDDQAVLNFFRSEWGVTTVVEPARHGFELLVWILPFAALALGIVFVVLVVRKWHMRPAEANAGNVPLDPHLEALRARARRETEI